MTLATLLALLHGGDDRMEAVYFWSAILIVLLPVSLFVTLGVWLWKKYRKERAAN
jgi:lipopolysaccharide export LptBFGC system permease protein LptF